MTHLAHHLRLLLLNPHQGHSKLLLLPLRQGFPADEKADSVVIPHPPIHLSIYLYYRLTSELLVTWVWCTLSRLSQDKGRQSITETQREKQLFALTVTPTDSGLAHTGRGSASKRESFYSLLTNVGVHTGCKVLCATPHRLPRRLLYFVCEPWPTLANCTGSGSIIISNYYYFKIKEVEAVKFKRLWTAVTHLHPVWTRWLRLVHSFQICFVLLPVNQALESPVDFKCTFLDCERNPEPHVVQGLTLKHKLCFWLHLYNSFCKTPQQWMGQSILGEQSL